MESSDCTTVMRVKFWSKQIIAAVIIGMVLRVVLGFTITHGYDMYHWGVVIENIDSGNGLYEMTGYFYTPVWGYIMGVISFFQDMVGVDMIGARITEAFPVEEFDWFLTGTVTTPVFGLSIKIFFFLTDLLLGYVLYHFIYDRTEDVKKATTAFVLWFLCPYAITVGAVNGFFDSMSALLLLLCVVMLMKDHCFFAGVMLSAATLTKFFPGFLIFILVAYVLVKHRDDGLAMKKIAAAIAGAAITALVVFLPQIIDGTIMDCFLFITSRSDIGLNIGLGWLEKYGAVIAYSAFILVSIAMALYLYKKSTPENVDDKILGLVMLNVAILFLYPSLPQYLVHLTPFLVIFIVLYDKRFMIPWIVLAIGVTMANFCGGPIDFLSLAVYTDVLSVDSVMAAVSWYGTLVFGKTIMFWMYIIAGTIQYIGVVLVLWTFFKDDIVGAYKERKSQKADNIQGN